MSKHKNIFVTGGASGIGREVGKYFGARGWFVGLSDIDATGLAESAQLIPQGMSSIHLLDVRSRDQWEAVLAEFTAAHGSQLHVLFNNAGVGIGGLIAENTPEEMDMIIDVNFRGVLLGAQIGHRYLKATPGSCLLNNSSASGIYGSPGLSVYSATKFGVRGLSEALDGEWQQDGIKVRALLPSFIDTPLLDRVDRTSNLTSRDKVKAAGMELSPVEMVAKAAWDAVTGDSSNPHSYVGKTARQMAFATRWMPWVMRKRTRKFVADTNRLM